MKLLNQQFLFLTINKYFHFILYLKIVNILKHMFRVYLTEIYDKILMNYT